MTVKSNETRNEENLKKKINGLYVSRAEVITRYLEFLEEAVESLPEQAYTMNM